MYHRLPTEYSRDQLDIFHQHEFLLDQRVMSSDWDHRQVDRRTDPNRQTDGLRRASSGRWTYLGIEIGKKGFRFIV